MKCNRPGILLFAATFLLAASLAGCSLKDYFGRALPRSIDETDIRNCLAGIRPHEAPEQYYKRGRHLQKRNRHAMALKEFGTAVALKPYHVEAYNAIGVSCDALGQLSEAVNAYRKALELAPERADILNNLGCSRLLREDYAAAADCFRKAVARDRANGRYRNNLGLALAGAGDYQGALEAFTAGEDDAAAHERLGRILERKGLAREAREQFRLAAALREPMRGITPPHQWNGPAETAVAAPAEPVAPPEKTVAPATLPPPPVRPIIEENISGSPARQTDIPPVESTVQPGSDGPAPAKWVSKIRLIDIAEFEAPTLSILPIPETIAPAAPLGKVRDPAPLISTVSTLPQAEAASGQVIGIEIAGPKQLDSLIRRMRGKLAANGFKVERCDGEKGKIAGESMVYYREGHLHDAWDVAKTIPGWQDMKKVKKFEKPETRVRAVLGRELIKAGTGKKTSRTKRK